jgi:hypothetical protein
MNPTICSLTLTLVVWSWGSFSSFRSDGVSRHVIFKSKGKNAESGVAGGIPAQLRVGSVALISCGLREIVPRNRSGVARPGKGNQRRESSLGSARPSFHRAASVRLPSTSGLRRGHTFQRVLFNTARMLARSASVLPPPCVLNDGRNPERRRPWVASGAEGSSKQSDLAGSNDGSAHDVLQFRTFPGQSYAFRAASASPLIRPRGLLNPYRRVRGSVLRDVECLTCAHAAGIA